MFAGHTANILVSVISSCIIRFHERVELRLHSNSPGTTTPNPMQGFHGDTGICQTGMCLLMLGLSSRSSQLVFVSIRVSICETVTVGRGRCLRASCNINIACTSVFHHLRGVTENTGGRLGSAKGSDERLRARPPSSLTASEHPVLSTSSLTSTLPVTIETTVDERLSPRQIWWC